MERLPLERLLLKDFSIKAKLNVGVTDGSDE